MLDYIRSNAQTWGIKVVFGVIILVFVFWGVGSFNDGNTVNIVAKVNGDAITIQQFEKAYRDAEESIIQSNQGITREMLKEQKLGQQVLRELVQQSLVNQEAARVGIAVSNRELYRMISGIKAFQDDKGKFDKDAYARVLEARRDTPARFEKEMAERLLADKMLALIGIPVWNDPQEARRSFDFLREKRNVSYLLFPASQFTAGISPTDKEISDWYDGHKQDYTVPAKADLAWIKVQAGLLVSPDSIDEAAAQKWYDANIGKFAQAEQINVSHILVPLAEDAKPEEEKAAREKVAAIADELKGGKDFAAVADEHNGPNAAGKGGELGWVGRGVMVKPFEDAAFALTPGKVSEPVRSQFGLHLIKVAERREAGTRSFAEVRDEIRKNLAEMAGADKLPEILDNLIEDNILGKDLAETAGKYKLPTGQTGLLSQDELAGKLGIDARAAASLVGKNVGETIDTALEAGDSYYIVRVTRAEPASLRKLDEVRKEISSLLVSQKSLAAAMEKAREQRKDLAGGKGGDSDLKKAENLDRSAILPGYAPVPALAGAIFATKPGQWLEQPFAVTSLKDGKPGAESAILVRVDKAVPPDAKEWEMVGNIMANMQQRERVNGIFAIFVQQLFEKAKVVLVNPDIVNRVNL